MTSKFSSSTAKIQQKGKSIHYYDTSCMEKMGSHSLIIADLHGEPENVQIRHRNQEALDEHDLLS